ncbi:uncharacterized protein TM35_000221490 [Trypanosoma theileri]|uniref:ZZ-type domain-containing protein n=1 Tax=Trypanosoma theileri TaxID=67003 RepID=A0A1X0NTB1_9TRYP|nr:uncharacterized protein TM35_000221490 [Trypanosoma theileri]ORC87350.1 hypothetical protein TM35_000221490 [Trypanosoma theileri]
MLSTPPIALTPAKEKPLGSSTRLARPVKDDHASFWYELQQHPRTLGELLASPIGANFKSCPRLFAHLRGATARRYKVLSTWKRVFLLFQYPFILYFENDKETSRCKGLIYMGEDCGLLYYGIAPDGSGKCNVLCILPVVRRSIHHTTQQDDEDNYYLAFDSSEKASWMFNILSESKKQKDKTSLSWFGLQETSSKDAGNGQENTFTGFSPSSESTLGLNPLPLPSSSSPEILLLTRYNKRKIEEVTPSCVISFIHTLLKDCRKFVTTTPFPQPYLLQDNQSEISSHNNNNNNKRKNTVLHSCRSSYFTEERRLVINTDQVHINVTCKHCGESPVIGFLYTCIDCKEDKVSLCAACFRLGKHIPQHNFSVNPDPHRFISLLGLKESDKSIIPPSFLLPPLEYSCWPNFLISELILIEIVFRRITGQHESGTSTMPMRKSTLLFFWEWSGVESVLCLTEKDLSRVCRHMDIIEFHEFCLLVHLKLCSTHAMDKKESNRESIHEEEEKEKEEDRVLAELCRHCMERSDVEAFVCIELGLLRLLAMLFVFEELERETSAQDIHDVRRIYIHTLHLILTQDALLRSNESISGEETTTTTMITSSASLHKLSCEGTAGLLDCCALLILLRHCSGVFHPQKKIEVFDKGKSFLTHAIDRMNAKLMKSQGDPSSRNSLHDNKDPIQTTTTTTTTNNNNNNNIVGIPSDNYTKEENSDNMSILPLWLIVEVFHYTCARFDITLSDHSACEMVRRWYVGAQLKEEYMYVSSTEPHIKVDSLYYVEFVDAYNTILSMWRDRKLYISLLQENNKTDKSDFMGFDMKKKRETLDSNLVNINFSLRQVLDDVLRYSLSDPLHYYTTMPESLHPNGCDGCGMIPIIGYRYRCNMCKDYDWCLRCYQSKKEQHNPRHTFSRYPD